jgi:hypothetical protein
MPLLSDLTDDDRAALLRLGGQRTFGLASLIGASEPSLHRALTELRVREVIGTRYRRLVVRDVEALRVLS